MVTLFKRILNRIRLRNEFRKISSEMDQLSHYSGVEKNDDPEIARRYNQLDEKRELLIRLIAFA
jgi:hypothetical protein